MEGQQYVPSTSPIPSFLEELCGSIYSPPQAPSAEECCSPAPATPYSGCVSPPPDGVTSPGMVYSPSDHDLPSEVADYQPLDLENHVFDRNSGQEFLPLVTVLLPDGAQQTTEQLFESEDFALATAALASEATGSKLPLVKDELRYRIQKKRRLSGKKDLKVEYKEQGPEELTGLDLERKRRRKDSNRRAAAKCRIKKKEIQDAKDQEHKNLVNECEQLRLQVATLEREKGALSRILKEHITQCHLALDKKPIVDMCDVTLPDFDAIEADWQQVFGTMPN